MNPTEPMPQDPKDLGRFSLIIESENLALANPEGLMDCLETLAQQNYPITRADDILLLNSGQAPEALVTRLQERFNWLKIRKIPENTQYYQAKMAKMEETTGDIVIFVDSDCLYEPDWLSSILTPFSQPAVNIVCGETDVQGRGPYGLAMRLVFQFDGFSREQNVYQRASYAANNVAFRRELLKRIPFPTDLPLSRGICAIHATQLRQQQEIIWCHPSARNHHALPEDLKSFFWRFVMIGFDSDRIRQAITSLFPAQPQTQPSRRIGKMGMRLKRIAQRRPAELLWLPLALPIIVAAAALTVIGKLSGKVFPNWILRTYGAIEGAEYTSVNR